MALTRRGINRASQILEVSQPDEVNLIYTPTGKALYWDEGASMLKTGEDFRSSKALFYCIQKGLSKDSKDPWIEFSFLALSKEIMGIRLLDLRFELYDSEPPENEATTIFCLGPDPSQDCNYISFAVPCAAASAQCKASHPENIQRYFWTTFGKNDSISVVKEGETDVQKVRLFKVLTAYCR